MKTQTNSKTDKRDHPPIGFSKEVIMASIIGILPLVALSLCTLENEKKSTKE